jgi:hypothetical protein
MLGMGLVGTMISCLMARAFSQRRTLDTRHFANSTHRDSQLSLNKGKNAPAV